MGGSGSGRRSDDRGATTDDCLRFDIRRLARDGYLKPGVSATTKWSRPEASIGWRVHGSQLPTEIELYYNATPAGEQESIRYRVRIVHTACTFGGQRPWFMCPGVVDGAVCGRRVAVLYHRDRYFLCRRCHGLAYASQHEATYDRALRRSQKVRERLKASGRLAQPVSRPRYMHWYTFARLRDQVYEVEIRAMQEMMRMMDRMGSPGTRSGKSR